MTGKKIFDAAFAPTSDTAESQDPPKKPAATEKRGLSSNLIHTTPKTSMGQRIQSYLHKWSGSETTHPPALSTYHSIFCFFGTFFSCLVFVIINKLVKHHTGGEYSLERGSYGSLVAAQYLLIAAPAAQPSNALVSQFFCGIIAVSINNIPKLPFFFRVAFTPALVVFFMGKTRFIHPTAGCEALFYAYTGVTDLEAYSIILLNYSIAILIAIVINNISVDRQYPTYWFPRIRRAISFCYKYAHSYCG